MIDVGYGIGLPVGRPRTGWAESKEDDQPKRRRKRGLFSPSVRKKTASKKHRR